MSDSRTIFKKIIDGDIPTRIVYQDEHCLAFHDVSPQAPVHILLIPRKEIRNLDSIAPEDAALMGHMLQLVPKIAADHGLERGYRLVANCGPEGGQSVDHLHFHILGGRPLRWPPG
jgi:histidine triad (HIT) family protein